MGRTHTYRTFSLTGPGPIEVAPVHGPPPPSSVPLADPRAGINLIKLNHQTNQPPARESTPSVPNQPAAHPGGKGEGPAEQKQRLQTTVVVAVAAGAVAVVSVSAGAAYLFLRSRKKPRVCLDPENFREFKLVEKRQLSHNVAKFKFALPTPTSALGLPIGQHISCRGQDAAGEEVIKPYTPTTLDSDLGNFELVIKMYPQGRMSHHFREMKVGGYLSVKGPKGRFKYQPGQVRAFGMIAGIKHYPNVPSYKGNS